MIPCDCRRIPEILVGEISEPNSRLALESGFSSAFISQICTWKKYRSPLFAAGIFSRLLSQMRRAMRENDCGSTGVRLYNRLMK